HRRPHHRAADADPVLRAAHPRAAGSAGRAVRLSHVADPPGRRPGPRGPRGNRAGATGGGAGAHPHPPPAPPGPPARPPPPAPPTVRASTPARPDASVNSVPDLTRRAAIAILGTIAALSILATLVRSPLEEAANPLITPNPAKAPWYFLWLQEIVTDTTVHIGSFTVNGAFVGGVVLPGLLVVLLTAWPWLDKSPASAAGAWFAASRRRQNAVFLALCVFVVLLTIVGTLCRGPYWHFYWPWEAWPEIPSRI